MEAVAFPATWGASLDPSMLMGCFCIQMGRYIQYTVLAVL